MAKKKINPCIYNEAIVNADFTRAIVQNDKLLFGLVELPLFKELAPFKYTTMKYFSCGRSVVSIEGKYGVIDVNGKEIVPLTYEAMTCFRHDRAAAQRDGKVGVIDTQGNVVVDFIYDELPCSIEDALPMVKDGVSGVLDLDGNEIVPFIYDCCSIPYGKGCIKAIKDDKTALYDMQGKELLPLKYKVAEFKNGYVIAGDERDKCAVIDLQGKVLTPFEHNELEISCKHGFFVIKSDCSSGATLYNCKGEKVAHFPCSVFLNDDGIHAYNPSQHGGGYSGLYDYAGNMKLPVIYESIAYLEDKKYLVQIEGKEACVIDLVSGTHSPLPYKLEKSCLEGFIVTSEGKWGLINNHLEVAIPIVYDKIELVHIGGSRLFEVTLDGKVGTFDGAGNVVIPLGPAECEYARGYDYFTEYPNKGYCVGKKNKYGFLDASGNPLGVQVGEVVQKPKKKKVPTPICPFKEANNFSEGFAAVCIDDKWGYIDVRGNLLHPITLDGARNFSNGFASISGGEKSYINTQGEYVSDINASTKTYSWRGVPNGTPGYIYKKEENGKMGWIDHEGKEVIPCIYDGDDRFAKFISLAEDTRQYIVVKLDGKCGVVNLNGQMILEVEHEHLSYCNEGFWYSWIDGKEALYTSEGKRLTPHMYEYIGFKGEWAEVKLDGKVGLINREGKEIAPLIYDYVNISKKGHYATLRKNGKYGMIRFDGKEVCPLKYNWLEPINEEEGLTSASIGDAYGYIDIDGKEVVPFKYKFTREFKLGFAGVRGYGQNQWGVINLQGEEIMPLQYARVGNYVNEELRLIAVYDEKDRAGIFDLLNGKELIAPKYSDVGMYADGWLAVKSRGKWGFVDLEGNPLDYSWMKE